MSIRIFFDFSVSIMSCGIENWSKSLGKLQLHFFHRLSSSLCLLSIDAKSIMDIKNLWVYSRKKKFTLNGPFSSFQSRPFRFYCWWNLNPFISFYKNKSYVKKKEERDRASMRVNGCAIKSVEMLNALIFFLSFFVQFDGESWSVWTIKNGENALWIRWRGSL